MFFYLLFLAAAVTTSEMPTADLSPTEEKALQEIIALCEEENKTEEVIVIETAQAPTANAKKIVVAQADPITITNAIEPTMLEYKHWTGKYSPEKFSIAINGSEIDSGKTVQIPAKSSEVEIEYTYSFMNGMKTGGRKIAYQLNENITQANITFNWKDDWRVILDNGKAIKEIVS